MTKAQTRFVFGWAAAFAVALLGMAGCSGEDAAAQKSKPLTPEEQIKQIEANPHMPADARAAAEARLKAQAKSTETIQKAVNKTP